MKIVNEAEAIEAVKNDALTLLVVEDHVAKFNIEAKYPELRKNNRVITQFFIGQKLREWKSDYKFVLLNADRFLKDVFDKRLLMITIQEDKG